MSARDEASEPFMAEEPSRHQCFTAETQPLLIRLERNSCCASSGWERELGEEGEEGEDGEVRLSDPEEN